MGQVRCLACFRDRQERAAIDADIVSKYTPLAIVHKTPGFIIDERGDNGHCGHAERTRLYMGDGFQLTRIGSVVGAKHLIVRLVLIGRGKLRDVVVWIISERLFLYGQSLGILGRLCAAAVILSETIARVVSVGFNAN